MWTRQHSFGGSFVVSSAIAETKTLVRWIVRCSRDEDGAILCNPYKDEERHAAARATGGGGGGGGGGRGREDEATTSTSDEHEAQSLSLSPHQEFLSTIPPLPPLTTTTTTSSSSSSVAPQEVVRMPSAVFQDWHVVSAQTHLATPPSQASLSRLQFNPLPSSFSRRVVTSQGHCMLSSLSSQNQGHGVLSTGSLCSNGCVKLCRSCDFRVSSRMMCSRNSSCRRYTCSSSELLGSQLGQEGGLLLHNCRKNSRSRVVQVGVVVALKADGARDFSPALKLAKSIQTDSLPPFVRDSTMRAIDALGGRVTVGDVASQAGLKVTEAEKALQALAADAGGFLEVSDEGDVLYILPKDYRSNLTAKSLRLKLEPVLDKVKGVAEYAIRVLFGTALLASILIVYSTIIVLLSSGRSDDDNRGNRGGYQNQRYNNQGFSFYLSPADLFWYWDPYYYRRSRSVKRSGGMNFFESVFSFVFGDGDPNEGLEDLRWKSIGECISNKGGVVSAEELAPFLDVPPYSEDTQTDESFVLPVLLRFDGHPEVDDKGNILYRFPSLQRTAVDWLGRRKASSSEGLPNVYFSESQWNFSKASKVEQALVIGLGAFNLVGVVVLSGMLRDYSLVQQLRGSGLIPFATKILPLLQVYTATFFAIPAFRWFALQQKNAEIEKRNRARLGWVAALERAGLDLRAKLKSAREMAKRTVIGRERVIYSTEKDLAVQDYEAQEWEQRLKERN